MKRWAEQITFQYAIVEHFQKPKIGMIHIISDVYIVCTLTLDHVESVCTLYQLLYVYMKTHVGRLLPANVAELAFMIRGQLFSLQINLATNTKPPKKVVSKIE